MRNATLCKWRRAIDTIYGVVRGYKYIHIHRNKVIFILFLQKVNKCQIKKE
jgi:hypothetical protein